LFEMSACGRYRLVPPDVGTLALFWGRDVEPPTCVWGAGGDGRGFV